MPLHAADPFAVVLQNGRAVFMQSVHALPWPNTRFLQRESAQSALHCPGASHTQLAHCFLHTLDPDSWLSSQQSVQSAAEAFCPQVASVVPLVPLVPLVPPVPLVPLVPLVPPVPLLPAGVPLLLEVESLLEHAATTQSPAMADARTRAADLDAASDFIIAQRGSRRRFI